MKNVLGMLSAAAMVFGLVLTFNSCEKKVEKVEKHEEHHHYDQNPGKTNTSPQR